jgi:hypothetical protein
MRARRIWLYRAKSLLTTVRPSYGWGGEGCDPNSLCECPELLQPHLPYAFGIQVEGDVQLSLRLGVYSVQQGERSFAALGRILSLQTGQSGGSHPLRIRKHRRPQHSSRSVDPCLAECKSEGGSPSAALDRCLVADGRPLGRTLGYANPRVSGAVVGIPSGWS